MVSRLKISKRLRRLRLIEVFGGSCSLCGYSQHVGALVFHHVDASEKSEWQNGWRRNGKVSLGEIEAHPERFQLLCANCHFIIQWEQNPHEEVPASTGE